MSELTAKRCLPCEGGVKPMTADEAQAMLTKLDDRWAVVNDGKAVEAMFEFKGFFRTVAFVNAVAWIAIREDHHPDITFTFNTCKVTFSTHAIDGLSENDFICAAKVDALQD